MEQYRTEEEQIEALRRWWSENGRSTVFAIVIALAAGFGWQGWQAHNARQLEQASDLYQALLQAIDKQDSEAPTQEGIDLAEQLKRDFSGSAYAQFAALHLAAMSVNAGKLEDAQAQLRWALADAPADSDVARIARQRLARVLAASGDPDQALKLLSEAGAGPYGASYAVAEGDILLAAGREQDARSAYSRALELAGAEAQGINLPMLQQKIQSLEPVPPRGLEPSADNGSDEQAAVPTAGAPDKGE